MGAVSISEGLILTSIAGGCLAWLLLLLREFDPDRPDAASIDATCFPRNPAVLFAVALAYLLAPMLVHPFFANVDDPLAMPVAVVISGVVTLCLFAGLLHEFETASAAELGLVPQRVERSLGIGLVGFLLAYPFVWVMALLTLPYRTPENQHELLKIVRGEPMPLLIGLVVVAAVVLAPLVEELLFRVVLQGTLRLWLRPIPAILISSVVFSSLHGWPDLVALLPLAIVLGAVYERTNDYWSVVLLHAAFNGFNLLVALLADPQEAVGTHEAVLRWLTG